MVDELSHAAARRRPCRQLLMNPRVPHGLPVEQPVLGLDDLVGSVLVFVALAFFAHLTRQAQDALALLLELLVPPVHAV